MFAGGQAGVQTKEAAPSSVLGSLGLTASLDSVARGPSGRWPLVLLCLGPVPLSDCQILIKRSSRSHPMSSSGGSQLRFMDPVFRMNHGGEGHVVSELQTGVPQLLLSWRCRHSFHSFLGGSWASPPHQTFVGRQQTEPATL